MIDFADLPEGTVRTEVSANLVSVSLGEETFWFSYDHLVAVTGAHGPCVRSNEWGAPTGRHLNHVDGGGKAAKAARLGLEDFEARASSLLEVARARAHGIVLVRASDDEERPHEVRVTRYRTSRWLTLTTQEARAMHTLLGHHLEGLGPDGETP